ncbi:3-hydroxyacyl-CoA dehydrogenase family protein [Kineosporia sp. J2-2]|uniref:3-hydroxyacyl-CoA dehydrogenase family protein n=1 Tax=Kineosporia corallincola TaxID=2835133 RepID=A0ABS5TQC5_9ACTN|nr:3-hydroxyacyl-CoA dehydrogenase family protein [Kineosporia corallincola]MBT0772361.1 3-hydroxyacyl-CoA dehydrogenase family protein [Kineosporia corallincola]
MTGGTDGTGAAGPAGPRPLAVLGAGVMGTAIAALAVGRGLPVVLVDVDPEILRRAASAVRGQVRMAQLLGKLPRDEPSGELTTTTDLDAVAGCRAVVEAVTERAETKSKVLAEVSAVVAEGTLIVSNTSAIPIDEQAGWVARPGDLVGIHFMNPPYLIRTAELIQGPRSSAAAMDAAVRLLDDLGQHGVLVGDGPGFVINRILQRMINEAARIVADGVATPEAVDEVFRGCLGHPTGPLATADLIGLDNVADSLEVLRERTGDTGYEPCDLLLAKVRAGDLGRKTGRGFFDYGGTTS